MKSIQDAEIMRITLSLVARSQLSLPGNGGEAIHGMLFVRLQSAAPALAHQIHSAALKPFSLFIRPDTHTIPQETPGKTTFTSGSTFSVIVNLLRPDLAKALLCALSENRSHLPLGNGFVSIADLQVASTSFQALMDIPEVPDRFRLQFLTPTTFRQKGQSIVFPDPDLLFSSLLRRWNTLSPQALPTSVTQHFRSLLVSRYRLETALVPFSRYVIVGFVGYCEYILPAALGTGDRQSIYALARFAEYAGVGYKTTMGLGATQLAASVVS